MPPSPARPNRPSKRYPISQTLSSIFLASVDAGPARPLHSQAMVSWTRADVVILTAIELEYAAVKQVDAGAAPGTRWVEEKHNGLPVALREFIGSSERRLLIAVGRAPDMGKGSALTTLQPLVDAMQPECIAMCGVCAGRPGKTALGDVVVGERLYDYDAGKWTEEFSADVRTYSLPSPWKIAAEQFDPKARFGGEDWWRRRPVPYEWQEAWVLAKLHEGVENPAALPESKDRCPQWPTVIERLRTDGYLKGNKPTPKGKQRAAEEAFRYPSFPDLSPGGEFMPFQLHVKPIGSGSALREDVEVWGFVTAHMRAALALEMEASALADLVRARAHHDPIVAVVMKGVMDFANHGRDDHFKDYAARASAECLIAFLRDQLRGGGGEAVAQVFTQDLATARRQYLEWAAGAAQFAERRRFAGAGVSPDQLASLELERVYVEPDLETDEWRRHGAQRERELAKRIEERSLDEAATRELRAQYLRLTASEHRVGVTQSGRRPLREVIALHQLLVICGDAGMGKTTLLQHRDLQAIAATRDTADGPIPVRFSVARFPADGSATLGTYALEQLRARWADLPESTRSSLSAAVDDHIKGGRVLLHVDGLNEALAAKRAVVNAIDTYVETHPTARVVLTTRRQAYEVPLRGHVEVWHLAPLDAGQRRRFLALNMSGRREMEKVWRLFEENTRLADLGKNPFFLVLASLLAQADLAGIRHRAQLYEKAFDRWWRDVDEDGIEWRRAVFAHVAAEQRADGRASDPAFRLDRRIDAARATLAAATESTVQVRRQALEEAGLFVREVGGDLSFFHSSFQEYLAAVHLTRAPIEDVPGRIRAVRADPDSAEVVLLALGRLAHVLGEPAETARALLALSECDDAAEAISGSGLLTAWQAIRDGVTNDDVVVGGVLARLATRVREIPDARAVEPFVLALLSVETTAAVRDEVLDELLLLVDAEHPVPWMVRHYALQVVARAARRDPRAAAACRRAWERFERQNLPEGVAAAMLVGGAELDESMLRPLGRALEHGWLEPIAEALARDPVGLGATLRRLAGSAKDQDATVCATLALLALRDEDMIEATLARYFEKHDALAGKAIVYLANRQDSVVSRVLDRASESEDRARQVARAVGRELAPSIALKHVVPWLLGARLDCARAWMNAIGDGQAEGKAEEALHDALRTALTGPPATAARGAALLTARMPFRPVGDVTERLARAAPALITRVDGTAACELLGALLAARIEEPARELLTRLIRTEDPATLESVLRNVSPYDPAVRQIVVDRMMESSVARDHHAVLACARHLASAKLAQSEVVAALRSVDAGAPPQLQTDAALILAGHGVHEVGIARTLARALAVAVNRNGGFRLSRALGEVVRSGNLRDDETFRLLLDGFMARLDDAPFEGGDALGALLKNDDALFELALDTLVTAAEPARKKRAIGFVASRLLEWSHASPPDERLLRRFEERLAGSPILFHEFGLIMHGRRSWYEALDGALADVGRNAEDALAAARELRHVVHATRSSDAATEVADPESDRGAAHAPAQDESGRLRSRIMAVLRQLLEHDVPYIALQAATELVFLGDRDVRDALHRALAGPPLVAIRATLALYGLGAEDDRVVAALLRCLSSDIEMPWSCIPEVLIAQFRLDASDQEPDRQAAPDSPTSSPGNDAGLRADDVVAEPQDGLAGMIVAADTVSATAAWLLVALRRNEVVPVLLDWIEGEDDRKRYQALAMLKNLGAEREPRVLACRIRQLRDNGWAHGESLSKWLWLNAPEAMEHVDALVDLLAKEQWRSKTLRAWLSHCCAERDDWAERVASQAESRPTHLAVELTSVLVGAGRVTESLAQRTVVVFCDAELAFLRPFVADLVSAIDAHDVLAAAWRQRLAGGTLASRVSTASLLWQLEAGPPTAMRDAIAGAFRAGLDDEDLSVRLDALLGLEHLGLVDDGVALAARRILDGTFGEAPTRVICGETADQVEWEARALEIRRLVAQRLLSWGQQAEAATSWLVGALRIPWPAWDLGEIVDVLRARGGHDDVLRSSLDKWLRDHPAGTPGEDSIIERAQPVGLAADVLDRRALEALGGSWSSEARAIEMFFGRELADDYSGGAFLRRHSRDPSERALYWAQRIAEDGIDVHRALRLLGAAVGVAPETINMLVASRTKKADGDVLAAVAELVRRRAADGFLEELGRAFLQQWVGQRMSAG